VLVSRCRSTTRRRDEEELELLDSDDAEDAERPEEGNWSLRPSWWSCSRSELPAAALEDESWSG